MYEEIIQPENGSNLRKNGMNFLNITIDLDDLTNIFVINQNKFLTRDLKSSDLIIKPNDHYMIINKKAKRIKLYYSEDISNHEIIYNPYKYKSLEKKIFDSELFAQQFNVPAGYINTLTKWYSVKFAYLDHNLIFVKPGTGLSTQIHFHRSERWEVLNGNPIIINGKNVWYYIPNGGKFSNGIGMYHSIINPNRDPKTFVIIKEEWEGVFDEEDIIRVFNPNNYF